MGTNLSLADIKKIARHVVIAYIEYTGQPAVDYPDIDYALATVLTELHLTTLANDLLHEIKNVRGD